jgi:hypothetical protein
MRLHRAARLRILQAEGAGETGFVQSGEAGNGGARAEAASGGRAEEAQTGARGKAEADRNIDADSERGQEGAAGDAAPMLGPGEGGRQQCRHRVQNRGFVDAVIFLAMHLEPVHQSGGRGREAFAPAPDRGFGAGAPAGSGV